MNETKSIELERSRQQIDRIAWVMDQCFRVPGLNWRFGVEALIGLIPGAGDVIGGIVGVFLLVRAVQFRLPKVVITRMIMNNLIDVTVGAIPFLGDAFDFFWKSNTKNMQLFHQYAGQPEKSTRSHWILIGAIVLSFTLLFVLVFLGIIYLASRTIGL
jgi:hypothetical protein